VKRSAALAVALALALVAGGLPARADEPPPGSDGGSLWPMAGAATAVGTLAIGGALIAQDSNPDAQKVGTAIVALGFATAPFIAHARSGRCTRALIFGLTSLTTSVALVATTALTDPYNPQTRNHDRIPFGIAMTTAFFAAVAGIVDGFLVAPARDSRP
jgi:hypothetical protein